jgi:hypothetical protein
MKLSGSRNQCQGCKEYFNSNWAFDKHRTGEYGLNRRCRSPEEMKTIGMQLNAHGFWIGEPMEKYHAKESAV